MTNASPSAQSQQPQASTAATLHGLACLETWRGQNHALAESLEEWLDAALAERQPGDDDTALRHARAIAGMLAERLCSQETIAEIRRAAVAA